MAHAHEAAVTLKYIRGLNQGLMDHLEVHGLTLEMAPAVPNEMPHAMLANVSAQD
jgi:hypothetical protein